jgi:hypothetical protein
MMLALLPLILIARTLVIIPIVEHLVGIMRGVGNCFVHVCRRFPMPNNLIAHIMGALEST